jgi:DNA-binding NtrC family response regulator
MRSAKWSSRCRSSFAGAAGTESSAGNEQEDQVNFRLISSTNKDLKHEVAQGRFREDLFYRLNVVQIDVPPLRERSGDIPLIATEILNEFSVRENRLFSFTDEVMNILTHYPWPGNIRQLRNVIERAVVLAKSDHISMTDLPEEFHHHLQGAAPALGVKPLKALERQAISEALQVFNGNKSKAARNLGISRKTLYKILNDQGCSAA